MNAEERTKEMMRKTILENMKEIQQMAKDTYWYDLAMRQLFGTAGLSNLEVARLTVIQNDINWLVDSYEVRQSQQESKEE